MKKFSQFVIRFRLIIIIICAFITGVTGFFLKDIKINPDIVTYLPANDSVVKRFNYIGDAYSASSMAIIIVEHPEDVFNPVTLRNLNELTNEFKSVEGVNFVTSMTNVLDIRKTEDGLEISRLMDEYNLPQTPEALAAVKKYTLSKKLYRGRLVSEDARYTVIVCRIAQDVDRNAVATRLREIVESKNYPEKFYFEGIPFQFLSIMDYIVRDLLLLTPLIVLLVAFTLFLSFRNFRGVLLPLLTVAMGVVWSMGLMSILGYQLTPISDAIPVVLFAVGSAYGIHVVNRFRIMVTDNSMLRVQSAMALESVGLAVLLAGVTTVAGFLSFVFGAYLNIISEFGIFSALGVLFILILSLTFTPALLSYFHVSTSKAGKKQAGPGILDRWMNSMARLVVNHKKAVLISSLVLVMTMVAGIPFIRNKIDILNYFRPETSIRVTARIMNTEFGGSLPLQILVKGDIQDPSTLRKMKDIQHFLDSLPGVNNAQSVADYIEEMNDCMGEGKAIPDSRDKVSNLWFLIEGEEILKQLVNADKTEAIIQAYVLNVDTRDYHLIYNSIEKYLNGINSRDQNFTQTGLPSIYANFDDSLMKNLLQSMLLSLALIFICMLAMLRSVKGALAGMIPLSFTMVIVFGFMGYAGIALDIATVLIASITVGAGIDYAIHFITEYKNQISKGLSIDEAIAETIRIAGRAIIINVITIMLGFLILIFANLLPLLNFGILIAITMFFSGLGAITLLPSVISLFKLRMLRNTNKA